MVKKYALTIKEEVMSANNKTVAQLQELLVVLSHYGTVVDYDADRKAENTEYQASIDGLKAQLEAIKEQKLTADEIEIIRAYRAQKSKVVVEKEGEINALRTELNNVKTACEQRLERVKIALGEE